MPPSFHSLPVEIQRMILQDVSREPSTAPYASVSKAWQDFFESKNFKSLAFDQDDLPTFNLLLVPRRRGYVKHIWYRIRLPNSNPRISDRIKRAEKLRVTFRADKVFTGAVFGLWDKISLWNPQNRITLELSVFAYDDWHKGLRLQRIFERDLAAYKVHKKSESREPYHYDDPHEPYIVRYNLLRIPNADRKTRDEWNAHRRDLIGWKNVQLTTAMRAREPEYYKEKEWPLPRVPIVSKFLIRNTQFRRIYPGTLRQMFQSFENLEDIKMERWALVGADEETEWTRQAAEAFAEKLPASVKTLSINRQKSAAFHDWTSRDIQLREVLGKRFRQYTKNLEHCSLLHIIDAKDFLNLCPTSASDEDLELFLRWKYLETLTLSTHSFRTRNQKSIERLLCDAARAARRMRNLRTLEIISSTDPQCLFRYKTVEGKGVIKWSGPVVDSTRIMKEWEKTSAWKNNVDIENDF
ncbi:hypothetical protein FPCIR_14004 [Fusarium pseudocircinatum]|uniref:DUF6546 domain-containing protein n=1 Tax=Fusarium pseudocircinatum TaxID=56676 RepID=A0A8H5KHB7_9HYPO|nr:hypothetical protein FPCIR_14004 [Fusarium pseudocircinatum]